MSNDSSAPQQSSLDDQAGGRSGVLAAAGREEDLFRSALDRYDDEPGATVDLALYELTAREVAHACLHGAVRAGSRTGQRAHELAVPPSEQGLARIAARLHLAKREGDLPGDADPRLLARYLVTLADGIATEAAYGVGHDELHQIADVALQAWPSP